MLKHIIFDFDGTLVDSKEVFISAYNQLADKYRVKKIESAEIEQLRRLSITERSKYLQFPLYKMPLFTFEFMKLYKKSLQNIYFHPGIKDLLDKLQKMGYELSILSSNSEENIREFLHKQNVNHFTNVVCSSNIFGKEKLIRKFLKTNNLVSSEVIYVGDELRDIVASKKCGIKVIWVSWGYDVEEKAQMESPDFIVSTPQELLDLFQPK